MNGGKTILLCWELGAGFGYALKLREIAKDLAAAGHRPVLALRSLEQPDWLFAGFPHPVLQAPWIVGRLPHPPGRQGLVPTGYADLMAVNGYGSVDHLSAMLRGWRDLIDLVKPALLVATHAPIASLAAYERVPVVLFGSAYYMPPADGDVFPRFNRRRRAHADQEQMLAVARAAQARFGAPLPERITDVYRGDRRIVVSMPDLDPYRSSRNEPCAGAFESYPAPTESTTTRFHAYLAGTGERVGRTIQALSATGLPGSIHVRGVETKHRPELPEHIQWLEQAPEVMDACRQACVIVHHGGPGTAMAALLTGRPQVLLPNVFDQALTADCLRHRPFVRTLSGQPETSAIATAVGTISSDISVRQSATRQARALLSQGLHNARQRILETCRQVIAG